MVESFNWKLIEIKENKKLRRRKKGDRGESGRRLRRKRGRGRGRGRRKRTMNKMIYKEVWQKGDNI